MLLKLNEFSRKQGICYSTAYRWWKRGLLNGLQNGKLILIDENNPLKTKDSSSNIKEDYLTIQDSIKLLENSNQSLGKQFSDVLKYLGIVTRNIK
jgi:predicted site-specific integrase-resolvase